MRSRLSLLILSALLGALTACSSSYVAVPDAVDEAAIDAKTMSCSRPYILAQDCSDARGALGRFEVEGVRLKTAANAAGDRVVVFADSSERAAEKKSNRVYAVLKDRLLANDFKILKVEPIARDNRLIGYAVKTDKPVYEFLLAQR